ncbi:MAG: cysteine desulfurase family protein [Actinomycetota bacterium]
MSIYLDHAASTPLLPEVVEAMAPFLTGEGAANASSLHALGRFARAAVEEAREVIAEAMGVLPFELLFTSGGTEADNLAIKGCALAMRDRGRHLVVSAIEHHAVLRSARWLEYSEGFQVSEVAPDHEGIVHPEAVVEAMRADTVLVSVMAANNEVGTIQDVAAIALAVSDEGVVFHTDAVQSFGTVPISAAAAGIAMASASAHKLGGPKGVGCLAVRRGTPLVALLHGGGQERDLRAGTLNVPGIVGFAAAVRHAQGDRQERVARIAALRDRLEVGLTQGINGLTLNGHRVHRLPGHAHVSIPGLRGEDLLVLLDERGIACSTGAACASGAVEPSHVLVAMGLEGDLVAGSLRFSIGRQTSPEDVDSAAEALPRIVEQLRADR